MWRSVYLAVAELVATSASPYRHAARGSDLWLGSALDRTGPFQCLDNTPPHLIATFGDDLQVGGNPVYGDRQHKSTNNAAACWLIGAAIQRLSGYVVRGPNVVGKLYRAFVSSRSCRCRMPRILRAFLSPCARSHQEKSGALLRPCQHG